MTRPHGMRIVLIVPILSFGISAVAGAETSVATPQPNVNSKKALSKTSKNDKIKVGQDLQELTPAQQIYGLPKNPSIGGTMDLDLTKPLSLERSIQIGLSRQNSIAIAKTQADAAGERVVQARASYLPQITPGLQYQASRQPGSSFNSSTGSINRTTGSNSERLTEQVAASQLIFDSGRREAKVGLSRRSAFASEYELGNERQNVILIITQDYYNLLRDRELVRVQDENTARAAKTLESIQAQVEVGNAAKSDTLQAEADLANAQVAVLQAKSDANVAQALLKNSMGIVSSQPLTLSDDHKSPPPAMLDTPSFDDYVRIAYQNRLDLKAQQEQINAQGYTVKLAHINNGVSVDANISEGYQINPNSGEQRAFIVNFTYPLFDGGSTRAAVRETKALLEQQRRTLDLLQQSVRFNVEQSYLVREQARQRNTAAQKAVEAGQLNYDAALEKQKNGLVNILDVLNAQVQLVNAQVSLVQAIYDYYISEAQLKRNIGINDPVYLPKVPGIKPVSGSLNAPLKR